MFSLVTHLIIGSMSVLSELALLQDVAIFIEGKDEPFTASSGYSKFASQLTAHNLLVKRSYLDNLDPNDLERTVLLIIAGPRRPFTPSEFSCLRTFISLGINILIFAGEGGQYELGTNVNSLLADYGVSFARDSVVRSAPCEYLHPKEALIYDGIIANSPLCGQKMEFVYPFGCTLEICKPAVPVLTSGKCCFPTERPICSVSQLEETHGKIIAFGSLHAFHDQFIEKKNNEKLLNSLLKLILTTNELFHGELSNFPDAEDIPERPQRQFLIPRSVRAEPLLDEKLEPEATSIEKILKNEVEYDYGREFRLEAALIETARRLGVSFDVDSVRTPPKIRGYLPKLKFPAMPPEVRWAGAPTLPLVDIDEILLDDEGLLQKIVHEENDPEQILSRAGQLLSISAGRKADAKEILRQVLEAVIKGRTTDTFGSRTSYSPLPDSAKATSRSNSRTGNVTPDVPALSMDFIANIMDTSAYHTVERRQPTDEEIFRQCLAKGRCNSVHNQPNNIFL